jgi:hypothetical protein
LSYSSFLVLEIPGTVVNSDEIRLFTNSDLIQLDVTTRKKLDVDDKEALAVGVFDFALKQYFTVQTARGIDWRRAAITLDPLVTRMDLSVVYGNGFAFIAHGSFNMKDLFVIVSVNTEGRHVTDITLRPFGLWNSTTATYKEHSEENPVLSGKHHIDNITSLFQTLYQNGVNCTFEQPSNTPGGTKFDHKSK